MKIDSAVGPKEEAVAEVIKRVGQLNDAVVASRSENSELASALREFLGLGSNGPPNSPRRQGSKSSYVS